MCSITASVAAGRVDGMGGYSNIFLVILGGGGRRLGNGTRLPTGRLTNESSRFGIFLLHMYCGADACWIA